MSAESVRRALGVYHPGRRVAFTRVPSGAGCAPSAVRWPRGSAARTAPAQCGARILAYHSIGTPRCGANDLRPRNFERHLQIAVDDGSNFQQAEVIAEPDSAAR